ncbi:hypothetical protein ESY86_15030 [Subsaximicrobium wynnwilliamsii]|uniref:DUF748 domain-containing protein n=1 Tax=Subsaximicrobium wynnwilliamsii TaxID=291179 RepID=A0A5C6ZEI1_9FLAO|nr:hypothetical protein [Subsaximicrobium wynnwilliamsii]TXD82343.1 hypothetical protein ESY87_14620 [Subsaximicrobium wynnwilliamsii]TXD87981.1 hypothetical protein ESY86_15030 [Subsaximicrobium wynnwilliamsii]TXE01974.1 hypothetical protein ESY88_14195 [Subsaximicrobium wynnwilliamsii]
MSKKTKKTLAIVGIIAVVLIICFLIANYFAKQKLESMVANLPENIQLQYEAADISVLSGSVTLEKPLLSIKGKTTQSTNAKIKLESFTIEDLSYWDLIFNANINLDRIVLNAPEITYFHNKLIKNEAYKGSGNAKLKQDVNVKSFEILNASIEVFDQASDSLIFKTNNLEFKLEGISVNAETLASKLPLEFKDLTFSTKNLKFQTNEFDDLYVDSISVTKTHSKFSGVAIKTKYSKSELSQRIKKERDHFDVTIASAEVFEQDAGFHGDSIFDFRSKKVLINGLKLNVYRDKLVADDPTRKDLYSKMLRELKFNLALDELLIEESSILYEEKVKQDKPAGELQFGQLEASMLNVGNTYEAPVEIEISTNFMKSTPLKVNWDFDVQDVNDHFIFKADLGLLKAEDLNPFMTPNLNITLDGELNKTFFTIDANANTGSIDLKTDYAQFDINILKGDGKDKNKLLSGIVNLFVAKTSQKKEDDYRYGNAENVERDKTKSVFNFVWLNAKSGLLSAMTGGGKKE